ncbi:hypothetical protein H6784_02260 [Candidatus Nomurabacteria bacterium]|nr:hypothetical protein [Candidatus Nomurabacteria bacterium]
MIYTAAIYCVISIVVFLVFVTIVYKEGKRGRRFFATGIRNWLDDKIDAFGNWLLRSLEHFVKYIVQLHWYYSIHSVLKTLLQVLVKFYTIFETIFERNRARAKQLRSEKKKLNSTNHLSQMAAHKEDTELTPAQKKKLRHKNLEGKH